mgnify:CR=1 FL=1
MFIKQRKKDERTRRQLDKHTNRHTDKKTKPQLRQKRKRTICSPTFVREVLGQNKNNLKIFQQDLETSTIAKSRWQYSTAGHKTTQVTNHHEKSMFVKSTKDHSGDV